MAGQAKKTKPAMSPEMMDAMSVARARVAERQGARAASDVVNEDKEPRKTFSLRMDARELHRLRVIAMLEGEGVTELARRLVLEGLANLEVKHLADSDDAKIVSLVEQLKADVAKVVISTLTSAAAPTSVREALEVVSGHAGPKARPSRRKAKAI